MHSRPRPCRGLRNACSGPRRGNEPASIHLTGGGGRSPGPLTRRPAEVCTAPAQPPETSLLTRRFGPPFCVPPVCQLSQTGRDREILRRRSTSHKCQPRIHLRYWTEPSRTQENTPNNEWGSVGRRVASSRSDFVDRGAVGRKKAPRRQEPPRRPPTHRLS